MTDNSLINTLDNPGEFDVLTSLRKGEPYFLLVGRDRFAPDLVREWADQNRRRALAEFDEGLIDKETRERELRKSTQAEEIACDMRAYKAGHENVVPAGTNRPSYTGHVSTVEQAHRDAVQKARVDSCAAINNAVGEMTDLMKLIESDDDPGRPHLVRCIRETIKAMNACGELVRVKRPGVDKKG